MKIRIITYTAVFVSIFLTAGLFNAVTHSGEGLEQAYSLLPGVPTDESPFAEFINSSDFCQYPPDYNVISQRPYIIEINYSNHTLIDVNQALETAWAFLESTLTTDDFEMLSYSSSWHDGMLPRWQFMFLNSTQDSPKSALAFVGVSSITGDIVSYTGLLPASVNGFITVSNETEIAREIFSTFNTSIPSNSRYEQSADGDERFFFIFSQVVGPILLHSSIGSIFLEIDTRFGGKCYYGVDWVPFSDIPTENLMVPNTVGYEPRSLMLVPTPYDMFNSFAPHEFRLCWWLNPIHYSGNTPNSDLIIDAFSGEIIQYIHYNYNPHTLNIPFTPLLIPSSGIIFAFVAYLIAKRKITTEPRPK
ncbi:MAG: hypothetical protein ACTSUO_01685 [Candidatus Thorarchaeota archaeon]